MRRLICLFVVLTAIAFATRANAEAYAWPQHQSQAVCPPSAVVLDFSVSPRADEERDCCTRTITYAEKDVQTEKDSRGWWFGRQELYFNSNVGRMAADVFSDVLKERGIFVPYSRGDLKYYYADKKDLIRDKLNLNQDQLEKAILTLNPVSIGRELGVQKVVVGHICDSELRKAVAPGSFASVVSMQVAIFDVATGKIEFQKCYRKIKNHSTQYFHYKKIAAEFSQEIGYGRGR